MHALAWKWMTYIKFTCLLDLMQTSKTKIFLSIFLTLCFCQGFSQDVEHNAWLFWSHQQKIGERWQLSSDVQVRSADNLDYVNTLLIRPGIGYKIAANQTLTLGYTYFGTWEKEKSGRVYEHENRIFEQFQIENEIKKVEITNRLRYEQRFMYQQYHRVFTQRLRHYLMVQVPLLADPLFTKGLYTAFQNEIFLNVQGQEHLTKRTFDQNRTYLGLGYRFSQELEMEGGYMFRYIIAEENTNVRNNIFQISVRTSF